MPDTNLQEDWRKLDERVESAQLAVSAQNAFGLNLLRAVVDKKPRGNVFLSPVSAFVALAMAEAGAAGSTRSAIRKTLALPVGIDEQQLHASLDALQCVLKMPGGAQLTLANALWTDQKAPVSPAFVELSQNVFRALAASLDFQDPAAARHINNWVSTNTKGKIPEIVTPDVVRAAVVILTNAVYFAAKWNSPFAKSDTVDAPFGHSDGSTRAVPMMHHADLKLAYREGPGFTGAALRYQASSVLFYALLPAAGTKPADVLAHLDLAALLKSDSEFDLDLKLPRFSLDFGESLSGYLKALGMDVAFHYPQANFRPMGSELFFISDVIQKTRLEVDEEGTVAAAATAVLMGAGAGRPKPQETKVLVFDRPFVALIADERTGALLFAGTIERP